MKLLNLLLIALLLSGCVHAQQPVIKPAKSPCYRATAEQFARWNKVNGKVVKGLTNRRQKEMQLFLTDCE